MEAREQIKFNPERRPGIPRGARGGETVFHKRAALWDAAKTEYDNHGKEQTGAMERYERYATWMENQYALLTESMRVASEAIETAGLTEMTDQGKKLYEETRRNFLTQHKEQPPA